MKKINFGFCLPIFANPGIPFFRTPNYPKLMWDDLEKSAILAEQLGYDSIFVADHLFLGKGGEIFEAWTTIAALAGLTSKIKLGTIHLCDSFRNPALLAKMISTLSHLSKDRFIWFYDYGWRKKEFDQYGFDFLTDSERIAKMSEGIEIVTRLLREDEVTFNGKYYKVEKVICSPKPLKKIPLWMGETNNQQMVESIAKYADGFNSMPVSRDGYINKLKILETQFNKIGRDFSKLVKSLETQIFITDSQNPLDHFLEEISRIKPTHSDDSDILEQLFKVNPALKDYSNAESLKKEFIIGNSREVTEQLVEFTKLGVEHFMLWFMDFPELRCMKEFAQKVIPNFTRCI